MISERRSGDPDPNAHGSDFDPIAPETLRDPHAAYAQLRRECPLAHGSRWGGFWVLSRYQDIVAVIRDHETFVNSIQNVVPAVTSSAGCYRSSRPTSCTRRC